MDTLTVSIPVLGRHESMLAGCFLREVPYLVRAGGHESFRCLREAASAVERGHGSVTLTTTSAGLVPLALACREAARDTYRDNPAIPVLAAITVTALAAATEA